MRTNNVNGRDDLLEQEEDQQEQFDIVSMSMSSTVANEDVPSKNMKSYIVTFVDDVDFTETAAECAALAEKIGGAVDFVYTPALNGCALSVTVDPQEELATQQARDVFMILSDTPVVMDVEEDQLVQFDSEDEVIQFEPDDQMDELDPTGVVPANNTGLFDLQAGAAAASVSWGLERMHRCSNKGNGKAPYKLNASGVKIYVVDSGIKGDHIEFKDRITTDPTTWCHWSASGSKPLVDTYGTG